MEAYDKEHFGTGRNWRRGLNWGDPEDRRKMMRRYRHQIECRLKADLEQMRAVDRISRDFIRRLDAQAALGRWIARTSPFSCFAMAAAELTDTGTLGRRRFLEQILKHQEHLARYGYSEWKAVIDYEIERGKRAPSWGNPANRKKPFPVFKYEPPATSEYVKTVAVDVSILGAATVLFFMLSYVSFLRYDVR
jgi:hypothetical protein